MREWRAARLSRWAFAIGLAFLIVSGCGGGAGGRGWAMPARPADHHGQRRQLV